MRTLTWSCGTFLRGLRERDKRHVPVCVLMLRISSCEPVSLAHDRPQPAYILRAGQRPAPRPGAPQPPAGRGAGAGGGGGEEGVRQVCPVPTISSLT